MSTQKIKHVDEAEFTAHPQKALAALRSGEVELVVVDTAGEQFEMHKRSLGRKRPTIFGCMKGTGYIPEGVDLTEPADVEWDAQKGILWNE